MYLTFQVCCSHSHNTPPVVCFKGKLCIVQSLPFNTSALTQSHLIFNFLPQPNEEKSLHMAGGNGKNQNQGLRLVVVVRAGRDEGRHRDQREGPRQGRGGGQNTPIAPIQSPQAGARSPPRAPGQQGCTTLFFLFPLF
jgi:hypothetical protein